MFSQEVPRFDLKVSRKVGLELNRGPKAPCENIELVSPVKKSQGQGPTVVEMSSLCKNSTYQQEAE
jgi:hypothetical protein